jgi:hypothetical protein
VRRPSRVPAALAGPALALALALAPLLAGCAGTDPAASASGSSAAGSTATPSAATTAPTSATRQRIEVTVAEGRVSGDTGRIPVVAGEQVTLVITSDVADEVHVHGYDLTADLAAGTPAELSFTATIPGVFEVELHDAGTVLRSLQVG